MNIPHILVNFWLVLAISVFTTSMAQAQRKPVPVFATEVKTGNFVDRLEALGTLRANESVTLSSSVTETIHAIHFSDGQRVEAGAVLVEMTNQEEQAQLAEANSTVAEAKRQYERVQKLTGSSSASESVLDQRRREYETAKARLLAIKSRLKDRLITAPFAGVVGIREISSGALVQPGTIITTLDDDSVMKLDFTIPSSYLTSLYTGMSVIARAHALGNREFSGEVSSINFRIDPVTRAVLVRALLPNPEQLLRPGLLMNVALLKNPRDTIVIPEEAIVTQGKQHFVFKVKSDDQKTTALQQEVILGSRIPGEVEVLEGLSVGDLIITRGNNAVSPGTEINIKAINSGNAALVDMLQQQESNN